MDEDKLIRRVKAKSTVNNIRNKDRLKFTITRKHLLQQSGEFFLKNIKSTKNNM